MTSDTRPLADAAVDRDAIGRAVGDLAAWAAIRARDEVPEATLADAALVLFDDIAAMVAARDEPEPARLQQRLLASAGPAEATVFNGRRDRADRYSTAVANAAAGDWCELDEGYRLTTCHAGLYVLPALLAEAEAGALTTAEVLRCLAVAYEATTRFARAFPGTTRALHPHACFAAIGAAAATALARGASAEGFQAAVASAATLVTPGPFNHAVAGALVRNVWPAVGAWSGMRAADWAEFGITGLAQSPYDVFVSGFGADSNAAEMTDKLGADWAIGNNFQKLHACCQYAHSTVEATLDLLGRLGDTVSAARVARITIETHDRARALDGVRPATTLAAKFSLPHAAAATAVLGHAGAEAFAADKLDDREIDMLRRRVEIGPFEPVPAPPNDRPARVRWTLDDGSEHEAECLSARGGPDRPFTRDEILAKIDAIARPVYPELGVVAQTVTALDPKTLALPWVEVVARFTKPG
ncbi:MAG: MmgE/PrpD family protein [Alphaproteobacteria bacterium]|jgi:2-methylcitrate dehydratase PrpD|nr:MmgE/PrpD family protein [Alphaproteobacteria bacterium]